MNNTRQITRKEIINSLRKRDPESENKPERDTRNPEKENVSGKVDLKRGYHTDTPGDGEGDRNDTDEMEKLNSTK